MDKLFLKYFLFTISCNIVRSANILAIMPSPFYSHQATYRPLWKAMATKGHNLTLITTDPMTPQENITQIDLSATYMILEKYKPGGALYDNTSSWKVFRNFLALGDDIIRYQLSHPDLERVKNPKQYHCDLIIAELFIPSYLALGKILDCPVILVSSMDAFPTIHELIGNSVHPAMYSYVDFGFGEKLSFLERLVNTLLTVLPRPLFHIASRVFDSYVEEYIGKDLPKTQELYSTISLLFVNGNPIFYSLRPTTPITVYVGAGLHFEEPLPLSKDIQTYLDESKHGCIYFSFGSTVNSNFLTPEALETFRKTFEQLAPIRVLWKFENETMALKPNNVELRRWLPQHDILRHPNVKVFITQGGLQSMEEAIDSGVPMLGMPFYGDQINNVNKMVVKEFGLKLDMTTLDENSLRISISDLINNSKYKRNIERLSAISKDQPMSGLEKAVWWTEYVLRHGTTEHLRSPSADIPLYQYFFLDIMAFLCLVFIFTLLVIYYSFKLFRMIFRAIFSRKNKVKVN